MNFSGMELFLDDEIISNTRNIRRELRPADMHEGNPLLRREFPWEQRHICIYGSVHYDASKRLFRMWYNAIGEDYFNQQFLAYAESADGINWTKPMLDICSLPGHQRTNLLMGRSCNLHGPCVIRNPDESDPHRRYLMLFDSYPQWRPDAKELGIHGRWCYTCESPDGLHWSPETGRPAFAGKADSGQSVVWDPVTRSFKAYVRLTAQDAFGQRIRIWRLVESPDFNQWGPPRELMRTDEQDGYPDKQMQQLTVTRYGGIYIGLLSLFQIAQYVTGKDGSVDEGPQVNEVQLVTSRDGVHFTRVADRALFMRPSEPGGFGVQGYRTASHMVAHGDKVFIYCDGQAPHSDKSDTVTDGMEIGLATVPRDRFVALTPARLLDEAVVELVPLQYPDARLTLNAETSAAGAIRAELADFGGTPLPGFGRGDSELVSGDSFAHELRWQSNGESYSLDALPAGLRHQPLRLRLWLRQARVYSLRSANDSP